MNNSIEQFHRIVQWPNQQIMNTFVFFLGIVLGAGAVWVIMKKRIGELEIDLKRTETEKEEVLRQAQDSAILGIADFNRKTQEIKETRKQNILKELAEQGNIKTNKVADLLKVSRATAFRYLEELEKQGKIEQINAFGRNVKYKLK